MKEIYNKKYLKNQLKAWIIHKATTKDEKRILKQNELDEFKLNAYENSKVYKERTRR